MGEEPAKVLMGEEVQVEVQRLEYLERILMVEGQAGMPPDDRQAGMVMDEELAKVQMLD